MAFTYASIAAQTANQIGGVNTWKIGEPNTENDAKKFIRFAVHLFYGIKTKLASGYFTRSFLKPKRPGIRDTGYRDACQNINSALLANPDQYAVQLQPADLKQTYDNSNHALNIPPVDIKTAFLMAAGTAVNTGPIGGGGVDLANFGVSGIKAAILAVVECFVPDRFKHENQYHYVEFKRWLSENKSIAAGGIPDNGAFSAKDAIENWAKQRVKTKFGVNQLSEELDDLMAVTPNLYEAGGTLQGLGALNLQQLENKITGFKDYVSGLNEEAMKTYKDSVEGNEYGLFSKLSLDNDELRYTIKRLGGNPVPNFERSQIRNELQYKRCKIFKDIWGENEIDPAGANGTRNTIPLILAYTDLKTGSIGESNAGHNAADGKVREHLWEELANDNNSTLNSNAAGEQNAWYVGTGGVAGRNAVARAFDVISNEDSALPAPYDSLTPLLATGDARRAVAAGDGGGIPDQQDAGVSCVIAYVLFWLYAAMNGFTLEGGVNGALANAASDDAKAAAAFEGAAYQAGVNAGPDIKERVVAYMDTLLALDFDGRGALGDNANIQAPGVYWRLAYDEILRAAWPDIADVEGIAAGGGGAAPIPTNGLLAFSFTSSLVENSFLTRKAWQTEDVFNNFKQNYDTSQNANSNLKINGRQRSYITAMENIQLIADTAAAQMIKKVIKDGKELSNVVVEQQFTAAVNAITKNRLDVFNAVPAAAGGGPTIAVMPNQNADRIAAVHYYIIRQGALAISGGLPTPDNTNRFSVYTTEDIVPGSNAPPAIVVPPAPAPQYPLRDNYDAAIEAAAAAASKWVSAFEPK